MRNIKTLRKNFLSLFLIVSGLLSQAQTPNWTQLELSLGQPNLEFNPLKGIASNFGDDNGFPSSIKGQVFQFGALYNGNEFNFTKIDSLLNAEAEKGRFTILQINIDDGLFINPADQTTLGDGTMTYPGKKNDLPDFLDAVDRLYYLGGDDDFLTENDLVNRVFKAVPGDEQGNPSLVVNYNDQLLMDTIVALIQQLGERYNNDKRLFAIGWGFYGIFGELQLGSGKFWIDQIPNPDGGNYQITDWEMTFENQKRISDAYLEYFPDKYILARDGTIPSSNEFGFSDGLYFGASVADDGSFSFLSGLEENNVDNNWKRQIIGGEMDPFVQPHVWGNIPVSASESRPFVNLTNTGDPTLTNERPQNVQEIIERTHISFVYQNYMFKAGEVGLRGRNHRAAESNSAFDLAKYKFQNINNTVFWDNALIAVKKMGYTFHVNEYNLSASDGNTAIEMNIKNTGVAPMYANWDVEFACLDANNTLVTLGSTSTWNLDKILPGQNIINNRQFISDVVLPEGNYKVLMRVINPLNTDLTFASGVSGIETRNYETGKPLRFDNASQDADLDGWLTIGVAQLDANGNFGNFPQETTSLTANPYQTIMPLKGLQELSVTALPNDTNYIWTSNLEEIATVNQNGEVITFNETGDVIIKATTLDGSLEVEFPITINNFTEIPNRIEAEDYSEAIFSDSNGAFSIETNATLSDTGNPALGNLQPGDVIKYNVTVTNPLGEDFYMNFRASVNFSGPGPTANKVRVFNELNEEITTVDFLVNQGDDAGNFTIYQSSESTPFFLPEGNHIISLDVTAGNCNFNWVEFVKVDYEPKHIIIPTPENETVNPSRYTQISGINVEEQAPDNIKVLTNLFDQGDYVEYQVSAVESALYQIEFNAATSLNSGEFKIFKNGNNTFESVIFTSSTETQTYISNPIFLEQGDTSLRFVGGGANVSNYTSVLESLRFVKVEDEDGPQLIQDGFYTIKSLTDNFLTVNQSGAFVTTQTEVPTENDNTAKWQFTHLGDNIYAINSPNYNANYLGVPIGACITEQIAVTESANATLDNFRWKATEFNGALMFNVVNCTEKLGVSEANTDNVNVTNTAANTDNQSFILTPTTFTPSIIFVSIPNLGDDLIQAEDYVAISDIGGFDEEVAPQDEPDGGLVLANIPDNGFIEFAVEVSDVTNFVLEIRASNPFGACCANINISDKISDTEFVPLVAGMTFDPSTNDFDVYDTFTSSEFELQPGEHIIRIDVTNSAFKLNWIKFVEVIEEPIVYVAIPNLESEVIEAEDNVGTSNIGGFTEEAAPVDEPGGGLVLTNVPDNGFIEFAVDVSETTNFVIDIRASNPFGGCCANINISDKISDTEFMPLVTGFVFNSSTNSFDTYDTFTSNEFELEAGQHIIRIDVIASAFNLNWIKFRANNTLGSNEFTLENEVSVFPNPTSNALHISSSLQLDTITLYDFHGREVLKTNKNIINMASLASGVYLLNISVNNRIITKKVIKQ
ncbi:carbohydrate-binding protein [Winogradskyella jejuensis]|uniref:Por secretion system C-terminal sorting domain-containing protein n=1 Tax=Winogradskyella jejuensis TaxID=1089305 RepID=A0A1M5SQX8_9FLAO|nr:carbohydrate-binding protein [Winogradskyella jejuensis]SHH40728.1 Por secretion system C-terminal sorting domain-containing protein [Winogradskyella jejuensis]